MKKITFYLLALLVVATPMLQSCDNDGYSLGNFSVTMSTVRTEGGDAYSLEMDNGKRLWVAASDIPWYKPIDGQRTIANITLLSGKYYEYDHMVKVNYLSDVLTKKVEELTEENEEEFGNSPVYIEDMWVGGNYLNIRQVFPIPYKELHLVSLVRNTTLEYPEDGYVHLEYRYNEQEASEDYARRGYISFNLGEFGPAYFANITVKGIKVKINSIKNGEKELVFNYSTDQTEKALTLDNDVVNDGVR